MARKGIPCVWGNKTYPSTLDAARKNNIPIATFYVYRRRGYTCNEDIPKKAPVIWNNVKYSTQRECADANFLGLSTLKKYLRMGWTCDQDIIDNRKN